MIGENVGLEKIVLSDSHFKRDGLRALLAGLTRNTNLRILEIHSFRGKQVDGTDEFVQAVLSQTLLRELVVGPWDGQDAKPLLVIAAKNYHIERVEFLNYHIECLEFRWSTNTGAYEILEGTIHAITKLNKAGRGYLADRSRGPNCKAAGIEVLSKVSKDLDCIVYHLRENPLLCDLRGAAGGGEEPENSTIMNKRASTTVSHQEEIPVRSWKKRRTGP